MVGHYERDGEIKIGDTALDSPSNREIARQERMNVNARGNRRNARGNSRRAEAVRMGRCRILPMIGVDNLHGCLRFPTTL